MEIRVFHAITPNFGHKSVGPDPVYPNGFSVVATFCGTPREMETDEEILNYMFRWTNHVEEDWNIVFRKMMEEAFDDVDYLLVKTSVRSTSVGDVIRITHEDKELHYKVASVGFDLMEFEEKCIESDV